jgi:hypothetical protein
MSVPHIGPCSENRTYRYDRESTIPEILSDPVVKAVMDADGVDAKMLLKQLRSVAKNLID